MELKYCATKLCFLRYKGLFGLIRPAVLLPVQELFWHCKLQSIAVYFYIFILSHLTLFFTAASVFGLCVFNRGW